MWRAACLFWAALACLAHAQDIGPADYRDLKRELDGIITFDSLPRRAEPGLRFDQALYFPGAWLGEHFDGQQITAGPQGHDALTGGAPLSPLSLRPGTAGRNQSVAFHRGYGSNALFPLGPDGFGAITGRGEGAVAILFDHDQDALAVRLHTHYAAPLGGAPDPGRLTVHFYRRDGQRIATLTHELGPSIVELGWRRRDDLPDIAGIVILNTDPGGIALDDILFRRIPPLG